MKSDRVDLQFYPQTNLSAQLLRHQQQMIQFLFFTDYDIIYETFELKHASYLERRKGQVSTKFKTQQIQRHYEISSQKLHIRILRDDIDLDKHLSKLELLWHNRNIPYFHRYYFEKYIFTAHFKTLEHSISNQQKLFKDEQHIYYSIFRAINARESCIRQLKRSLTELGGDDVYQYLHIAKERIYSEKRKQQKQKYQIQGFKIKQIVDDKNVKLSKTKFEFFSDSFLHLTKLTLYVIELILKYREYIRSLTHDQRKQRERIEYYFYDDNYFLKILSDTGFLRVSFLSNFYEFAPKNDPFMLRCVLAFEKKSQKTLQHQLLKKIFLPSPDLLPDILAKLQFLSEQYKHNIRSRKVYDLKLVKSSNDLAKQKSIWNQKRQPISNLVLQKLSPEKSKSLKSFRVRQGQKRDKIVIQLKGKNNMSPISQRKAHATSLPPGKQRIVVETEHSPLKNSVILQKNAKLLPDEMIDSNFLNLLKEQVIKKIKNDFKANEQQTFKQNQVLEMYIDGKVKEAMQNIFPYQPQKQLQLPIEFTTLIIPEQEISTEIAKVFKKSIYRFTQMQCTDTQLMKKIQTAEYLYVVRATVGQQEIGRIFCTYDREHQSYKILKILYLGFYDVSQLQLLMLKFVEFLWKYQNSYEIIYSFFQPTLNEIIKQLLTTLQKNLQHNCVVASKQIYSNIAQVKFIFKRKHKNVDFIPNQYPVSLHASLYMLLAENKLMLENPEHNKIELLSYDYLLMQILRKYVNSNDFVILKERIKWKTRLKEILDLIIALQKDKSIGFPIKMVEADNITQLNKQLAKNKEKLLEVSDLVKSNTIKLLSIDLKLTLPYLMKSIYIDNKQFYRCKIKNKIDYWQDKETEFFVFPTIEKKNLSIVFFSGKDYIMENNKQSAQNLVTYIKNALRQDPIKNRQVQNFWFPMVRFPHSYEQRQDNYVPTYRVEDLKTIKRQLFVADSFEWFCSMQMQNGIKYQKTKYDIILEKPFGIGVVSMEDNIVLYARIDI